jgi:hypothetical protein
MNNESNEKTGKACEDKIHKRRFPFAPDQDFGLVPKAALAL